MSLLPAISELNPARVMKLNEKATLPMQMSPGAAGLDIFACLDEPIVLKPLERALIPTGFSIALPKRTEAQVRPRSGLAWKHGVTVLNSPGTIDRDYRGEVKVMLVNLSNEDFEVTHGMRIAQMVIAEVAEPHVYLVEKLDDTERGTNGFGSTGL